MPPTMPKEPQPAASPILPSNDELKRQLAEMDKRTAKSRDEAEGILQEIENKETREMLGLDIEFDVTKLITQGIVEKRGIKIMDNLFLDMHTLTKAEDVLAEQLVEQFQATMGLGVKLSKAYYEVKSTAMLAIAVTRMNNRTFQVPPLEADKRESDEFNSAWNGKVELLKIMMQMPGTLIDSLTFVYMNLDKADVLVEGNKQKKSSRP